jgi:hypothetical protein
MVHVIIDLADNVNDFVLNEGTLFSAGKDSTGKELFYSATGKTQITRASVDSIRNVFTEKQMTGIREAREANKTEPDAGVTAMLEIALGNPNPGNKLPEYNGNGFSFNTLKADYEGSSKSRAVDYARNSMFLSEENLKLILKLDSRSVGAEWETAYGLLDAAYKDKVRFNRRQVLKQKRESDTANGFMVMLSYALGDPNPDNDLPEYKEKTVDLAQLLQFYKILFEDMENTTDAQQYVRESLLMKEPDFRKIMDAYKEPEKADWDAVYTIVEKAQSQKRNFQPDSPYTETYTNIYAVKDAKAGLFTLKGEEGNNQRFKTFGKSTLAKEMGFAVPAQLGFAVASPQLLLTEGERTITATFCFTNVSEDVILPEQKPLYPIFRFYLSNTEKWIAVSPESIVFRDVKAAGKDPRKLYADIVIRLSENDAPVTAPGAGTDTGDFSHDVPVMILLLNNADKPEDAALPYAVFRDMELEKITIGVEAKKLKMLTLQNDTSSLDYKKPFEPFGYQASTDSSFSFAHPEISLKRLDSLAVHFDWMKPPASFAAHYGNYAKIDSSNVKAESAVTNVNLLADLTMQDGNTTVPVTSVQLFADSDAREEQGVNVPLAETLKADMPGFNYTRVKGPVPKDNIFAWPRYFRLELGTPDFQRDNYPLLLSKQAYLPADRTDLKTLVLNPPYTPKLKTFTVSYSASFVVEMNGPSNDPNDDLFHIHPFGFKALDTAGTGDKPAFVTLLPDYTDEGELYIGIKDLKETRRLALLFQMAEGSSDPDIDRPEVKWNYLSNDEWKPFPPGDFIEDQTNGLQNTGIITLVIPDDANNDNRILGDELHWIRAAIADNSTAITDTVNILAQSVQAVFVDNGNDPGHLLTPLASEKIQAPVVTIPEIKKLWQPYTSSKGKPAETGTFFYNRVSERLRHKNRAVTMWDYERIILDRFPEIHKVKCVPGDFLGNTENYGKVDVIVIPDIKGKLPFNPYQPKVAADLLLQVQEYISQRTPAFADVHVKNATFVQVKTRFTVKFNERGNEQYLIKKLEDELKRYLAPWAFDDGADITLGGKIYASMLVNFIAERSYVDYVAGIKLFRSDDGLHFIESKPVEGSESSVTVDRPDIVLVSAMQHEIDVVSDKGFVEKDFTGINYMKVELDFVVG